MKEEDIPDLNIFMMCEHLNKDALTHLPQGYSIRNCKPEELDTWKSFPFDSKEIALQHDSFMSDFFTETYKGKEEIFFQNTLFVCNENNEPVATCSSWKAYEKFHSIHWLKTLKAYEGKGLGRALLSVIMKKFKEEDYPIFLHTQPGSFRAVKLYSDFGFKLLSGEQFGTRRNDLNVCLPILKEFIPEKYFNKIKIAEAPISFIEALRDEKNIQF